MKYNCEIIKDLIPLYVDEVCSPESRAAVEAHLGECASCSGLYEKMKKDVITPVLESDADSAVAYQQKRIRRRGFAVGTVIAGIFMIPILVCLIVDLASGSGLSWFFIVLASLLVAASVIIVPLMAQRYKFLLTLGSFAASLVLLLGVIAIYVRGDWFFVTASSVLFGLSVVFLPIAVNCEPIKTALNGKKALAVFACDTVLYIVMALCIGLFIKSPGYGARMAAVSAPLLAFAWVFMLCLRYLPGTGVKTGAALILSGAFVFSVNNVVNSLLENDIPWPVFRPLVWNGMTSDGNIKWLFLLGGLTAGALCIILSSVLKGNKK